MPGVNEFLLRSNPVEARPFTFPFTGREDTDQLLNEALNGASRFESLTRGSPACQRNLCIDPELP